MTIYRGPGGTGDTNLGEDVFGPNSSITELTGISGPIESPTYIKFDSNANYTALQGELTWNTSEGTLDLGLNEGHVILQIGQETHYRITNLSGGTLPDGSLLAFSGTTGNSGKLLAELYDGTQPSKYIIGIATEDIPNGSNGYVTHFGKIRGIQTNGANYGETWVDGDELYPSPTGGLTKVLPEAPNAKQPIAVVVNSHVSDGILFVRVGGHTSLEDDELVQLTGLTDNDILQWDNAQGRFENRSLTTAGVQPTLVSGTNIKTVDGNSLLGSGNIDVVVPTDIGVSVQAYSANLDEYAAVNPTVAGLALLDDADASAQRTTLGLGTLATQSGTFSGISSGTNTGDQNLFSTIAVSGQSNVVADTTTDTLTLVAGTNISITTDATTDAITINASATGIPDGDKGDITVSGTGSIWTVDNDVITYAKIQNVSATDKLLGRSTAGAGDIEEIACTAAGRAILDDVDASAQRTTLSAAKSGANSDITSLSGLTTPLSVAQGGTGANTNAGTAYALKGANGDITSLTALTSQNTAIVNSASGAIGYGTGAGGTVTQATSKTTAVSLNKPTGRVTMNAAALAAGASVIFAINNSIVTTSDLAIAAGVNLGVDPVNYRVEVLIIASGQIYLKVTNTSAGSLSQALAINFSVIKGATS